MKVTRKPRTGGSFALRNSTLEVIDNFDPSTRNWVGDWRGVPGIYAIQAGANIVKVGCSANIGQRVIQHARTAAVYGVTVDRVAGRVVENFKPAERALIAWCAGNGWRVSGSRETFNGLYWDEVLGAMDRIASTESRRIRSGSEGTTCR